MSPSGKAPDFDSGINGSSPFIPASAVSRANVRLGQLNRNVPCEIIVKSL